MQSILLHTHTYTCMCLHTPTDALHFVVYPGCKDFDVKQTFIKFCVAKLETALLLRSCYSTPEKIFGYGKSLKEN